MVNPDVGDYTKTRSHRKYSEKQQPTWKQKNTKTELQYYLWVEARFLYLACYGGRFCSPGTYATGEVITPTLHTGNLQSATARILHKIY